MLGADWTNLSLVNPMNTQHLRKGGVHIMGEICPRPDPDIALMKYYLGLKLYVPLGMRFWITLRIEDTLLQIS